MRNHTKFIIKSHPYIIKILHIMKKSNIFLQKSFELYIKRKKFLTY